MVREDDARREVLRVSQDTGARQIALLVDTSEAACSAVSNFRSAVRAFIEMMHQGNEISIISYGGPPRILMESTSTLSRLQDGVGRIFAYSGSAAYLLDAMSETTKGLLRREAPRPVTVVLTTEGLDHSHVDSGRVLRAVEEASIAVYTVVLTGTAPDTATVFSQPNPGFLDAGLLARWRIERDLALSRGPMVSGGRRRDLLTSMAAERSLREVANELRNQYLVSYSRPDTLIPPDQIEVDVTREGLVVRGTPVKATQ